MHDTTKKRQPRPAAVLGVSNASSAYRCTGAKRHLHKNLPINVGLIDDTYQAIPFSSGPHGQPSLPVGFAHPVAFVDPLPYNKALRHSCPTSTWLTCHIFCGFIDVHTDSRLTNSHIPGSFNAPHAHIRAQLSRVLDRLQGCCLRLGKASLTMWQAIRISQRQQARLQRLESTIT